MTSFSQTWTIDPMLLTMLLINLKHFVGFKASKESPPSLPVAFNSMSH